MTASDFFFISAGLSICLVVVTWIFIFFKITRLINKAGLEVKSAKNNLKLSGLNFLSKILESTKGGENNESKKQQK